MFAGVRPSIFCASCPILSIFPLNLSTATTVGSLATTPLPLLEQQRGGCAHINGNVSLKQVHLLSPIRLLFPVHRGCRGVHGLAARPAQHPGAFCQSRAGGNYIVYQQHRFILRRLAVTAGIHACCVLLSRPRVSGAGLRRVILVFASSLTHGMPSFLPSAAAIISA